MKTSGHGNDSWMIFLTLAISMVVGTILFGGPADALEAVNALVGNIVRGGAANRQRVVLMTLSDILSRGVSLEWHEAVALVRGVVERLLEKSSQANRRSRTGSD